jgi:hypothetical protein
MSPERPLLPVEAVVVQVNDLSGSKSPIPRRKNENTNVAGIGNGWRLNVERGLERIGIVYVYSGVHWQAWKSILDHRGVGGEHKLMDQRSSGRMRSMMASYPSAHHLQISKLSRVKQR